MFPLEQSFYRTFTAQISAHPKFKAKKKPAKSLT
jgi:hypothetical protein